MKKILTLVIAIAVMGLLIYSVAFAASDHAIDNSKACEHASQTGKDNANENSVLSGCVPPPPPTCPPICG